MKPEDITKESIVSILLDDTKRELLLELVQSESGTYLPFTWRVEDAALKCNATPEQFKQIIEMLLEENDSTQLVCSFVSNSQIPDSILFKLLEQELCLSELGHRKGPQALLEEMASRHRYAEAIVTLAIDYYGSNDVSEVDFLGFIEKFKDIGMLKSNISQAKNLSAEKKSKGLALLSG